MQSKLTFYGGAGSVTGSNFLLTLSKVEGLDKKDINILVDCGLAQGTKEALELNQAKFAYDPASINYLIITHAHLDHIGRIPKLVRDGFKGVIISTEATKALAEPLLRDELALMSQHKHDMPHEPLYEGKDIDNAFKLWKGTSYHQPQPLGSMTLELFNSGHILGSAMAKLSREGRSILFTGDIGGGNSPLLPHHEEPLGINYLVMESVYGDRVRHDTDRRERLENVVEEAAARGGCLLIPAFSTERTQDLIYEIRELIVGKRVPQMPVYVDSPLAQKITESYVAFPEYFSTQMQKRISSGEHLFAFEGMHFVSNPEESAHIRSLPNPKIILAGSGMGQGGRVIAHEIEMLPDPKTTLLIVGYQAAGTIGRRLVDGASSLELYRKKVSVKAHIEQIYGYSAHVDADGLADFASKVGAGAEGVFAVMGEPVAANTLVQRVRDNFGLRASAPEAGESATLEL